MWPIFPSHQVLLRKMLPCLIQTHHAIAFYDSQEHNINNHLGFAITEDLNEMVRDDFKNQFPLKSLLKFKEEEDYLDNRVDVTDNINRNSIGEMNIVREMKIQSRDWLKRMGNSIYALKVEDFKVNRRLQCSRCDYKSF